MTQTKKQLALILLIVLLIVPAIHKLTDQIPPDWFTGKFKDSLIGDLPGGIHFSYYLIILLELLGPAFFIVGLSQKLLKQDSQRFISLGFLLCYILFLILTFGSFLVQDYDNGFKDFIYFVGIVVLERFYLGESDLSSK